MQYIYDQWLFKYFISDKYTKTEVEESDSAMIITKSWLDKDSSRGSK